MLESDRYPFPTTANDRHFVRENPCANHAKLLHSELMDFTEKGASRTGMIEALDWMDGTEAELRPCGGDEISRGAVFAPALQRIPARG